MLIHFLINASNQVGFPPSLEWATNRE